MTSFKKSIREAIHDSSYEGVPVQKHKVLDVRGPPSGYVTGKQFIYSARGGRRYTLRVMRALIFLKGLLVRMGTPTTGTGSVQETAPEVSDGVERLCSGAREKFCHAGALGSDFRVEQCVDMMDLD